MSTTFPAKMPGPQNLPGAISTNMDWILGKTETDIKQVQEKDFDTSNMGIDALR